ncbi:putative minus-end-directed kinesin ATPase [Dioscorea sansibarensis]
MVIPETLGSSSIAHSVWMDDGLPNLKASSSDLRGVPDEGHAMQDCFDSMLCFPGSRLVLSGLRDADCRDDIVKVVNAGGNMIKGQGHQINFQDDSFFEGGDVLTSDEKIIEGGDYSCLYQSVRYGNFCYTFNNLDPGDYFLDLHFAEIVYTKGPKGIRVFDILSGMDIFAIVGANKPLQLVDVRVSVAKDEDVVISFKGISGSPVVCGICIRKAAAIAGKDKYVVQSFSMKLTSRYEKKIQELTSQYKLKNDECHQAWMLLTSANEQLEQLRMDMDNKLFQAETLEQAVERQTDNFRVVSERYEHDKKLWVAAINDLEGKIKTMKQEHSKLSQEAHECASAIPDLNKMLIGVETLVAQCEDLKSKYGDELARRKRLYNQVQEMKGNIRVFCRCRPLSKLEVLSGYSTIVDFEGAKDGDIGILTGGSTKKTFKFDRVYAPRDDQGDVYADASPLVTSVLDGYNVCIFAYGQTGTGKTFTMEGTEQSRGVNYRTLEELFKIAGERRETISYSISVSVLEVYNEQIRDLLATSPSSKKLEVRQAAEGFHHIPGIVEAKVENIKEVWHVLQAGSNARAVGSNNVNEHSSRSHCMLCIMVRAKNLMSGECTRSKLWLVDLAGSERLAKTDVQGERLKEAQNINRSLSALGDVISALATKSSHVPYRNSKLTHLLQDSLGGDSKALMLVQISPSENDLGETLSSLNFASRVRGIELGPAKKQIDTAELQKIKQMVSKEVKMYIS